MFALKEFAELLFFTSDNFLSEKIMQQNSYQLKLF